LITNNSDDDLINKENPDIVVTHRKPSQVKSIIKVPFSKYKIEADPVSDDEPESPEKDGKNHTETTFDQI